uniref:non-specific serine/threonine protein kinase n=1 Tax=Oryza punctata TaxID=4537 RepID=A0A0E0JPL8_ORYPU
MEKASKKKLIDLFKATIMRKKSSCREIITLLIIPLWLARCLGTDSISVNESLSDGQSIVSMKNVFVLGFFSPGAPSHRYVGIWHNSLGNSTVVWVGNRNEPLPDASGVLMFDSNGNLVITHGDRSLIVAYGQGAKDIKATILDSGNLVLSSMANPSRYMWQSFDSPTDTWLPEMKIGLRTANQSLISWWSNDDPAVGDYTLAMDPSGLSRLIIWWKETIFWSSKQWNSSDLSLIPQLASFTPISIFFRCSNFTNDISCTYSANPSDRMTKILLNPAGSLNIMQFDSLAQAWILVWSVPSTCEVHNLCGAFGVCNNSRVLKCVCTRGFVPRDLAAYSSGNTWKGCTRKIKLQCSSDEFHEIPNARLPDNGKKLTVTGLRECKLACLINCSCTAYAYSQLDGCSLWYGDLMNLQDSYDVNGARTLCLRLAKSELEYGGSSGKEKSHAHHSLTTLGMDSEVKHWESEEAGSHFVLFSFSQIANSTNNFSAQNKLGEGGFGPVYKGSLLDGQDIAVKRLATNSAQGLVEFKNEVLLIAKLQHVNLVRLLGCCIQGEEKILVYEYMPNKSLDLFLFEKSRRIVLDWRKRAHIIEGIAHGLLYLHKHSRLRIIHRDLKASNILLDIDMNPKISDFGMARIFGSKETQANTNRVVGTYGYMAPEYAMQGIFSVKSDVFSFGVLLLEIVSGTRNSGSHRRGRSLNLIGHAWELWRDGRWFDLVDPTTRDAYPEHRVLRCVHVGLMCVQENAVDRPTMNDVISMLTSESMTLPDPKQPAFLSIVLPAEMDAHVGSFSQNAITITDLEDQSIIGRFGDKRGMRRRRALALLLVTMAFFSRPVIADDSIGLTASIIGNQSTLESSNGVFKLGFFILPGGKGTYLGIWYASIQSDLTVVWVANRQDPVVNAPGVITLSADGRLVIVDAQNTTVWSSPAPAGAVTATAGATARLHDNGNLVVSSDGSDSPQSVVWQSFDYPTDTLLPGMKLGEDRKKGITRNITSWRSPSDPAPGAYTFKLVLGGLPEFFLFDNSKTAPVYASGPWNGEILTGVPGLKSQQEKGDFSFTVYSNPDETYYNYSISNRDNPSFLTRFFVDGTEGKLQRIWSDDGKSWINNKNSYPADPCDIYGSCGAFGYCVYTEGQPQQCNCLPGFKSRSAQGSFQDTSKGCARMTNLTCGDGDGFWRVNRMKLPDATKATVHAGMTLDQCRQECLRNCSCNAYAAADVSGGVNRGCVIWTVGLMDMRKYPEFVQDLYIRLPQSQIDALNVPARRRRLIKNVVIAVVTTICGVLGVVGCCCLWRNKTGWKRHSRIGKSSEAGDIPFRVRKNPASSPAMDQWFDENSTSVEDDLDLPLFDLEMIFDATDRFAANNKIGEGGFGPVYLGRLEDGQEVAVKRLSRRSVQGVVEFKNEVKLIAKLQHRNLVRLLGCCIDDNERVLVYEYMHNKSLDTFIFDEGNRKLLSWNRRFEIILGIARGLLYLHEDSRFRIIHRDLKASNVLLDRNMVPKVSDFGIARMFEGDQTTAYTRKVIGTYFGVLVLEIVAGRRNRGFCESELNLNLLRYAWMLWKEGKSVDLLDELIGDIFDDIEVLRCIHVALLCVEVEPKNRPLMSSVVMMLASENATLPQPNEPGVNIGKITLDTESSHGLTSNSVTITTIEARRSRALPNPHTPTTEGSTA